MSPENLERMDRALALFLKWASVGCLIVLFFLIGAGVFVRFVPVSSMGWADEVIELAFVWMVFLGATLLWRERTHFRVEVTLSFLEGSPAGRFLEIALQMLSLVFFLVYTYEGAILTARSVDRSPILDYPRAIWFVILPLTGSIIIGYILRDLLLLFRGKLQGWR